MTCTIGRVGVATASGGDGLSLADPFDWQVSGRQVTITGRHVAASDAAATWFAEQIMGLDPALNLDELSIPFTSTAVPTLDGFFTVGSAQATIGRGALGTGTRHVDWQITMTRSLDSAKPRIEIPHLYVFQTNTLTVTACDLVLGFPHNATVTKESFIPNVIRFTRSGINGLTSVNYFDNAGSSTSAYVTASYIGNVTTHYGGGVGVFNERGTVVGRRDVKIPTLSGELLYISNGLIRVDVDQLSGAYVLKFNNAGTWTNLYTFLIAENTGALGLSRSTATVLKNSADESILRISAGVQGAVPAAAEHAATFDIVLRRGELVARIGVSSTYTNGVKLYSSGALAGTSTSWGIRSTAAVTAGTYPVVMSNNAATRDLVNMGLASAAVNQTIFGIGAAFGVATNADKSAVDDIGPAFFVAASTTQRIVVG